MDSVALATNPLREGLRSTRTVQPCILVIFGATGDLTHRKLLPALYNLAIEQPLPPQFTVVGVAWRRHGSTARSGLCGPTTGCPW